jgi:dolichol-phosphate mannosyltransferase
MHNFSIIVPCLNEEKNIESFIKTVKENFDNKYNFKIIFVDDGSVDNTWNIIENSKKKFSFISGIKLSKNFGKENAISCGMSSISDEDFMISIDADSQHPIEKIPEMINLWESGYKIVNTFRINQVENNFREISSRLFYFFFRKFSDLTIVAKTTDFILIDKIVVKEYNAIPEFNKQYRTLINWLGFKKTNIPIMINSRVNHKSNYSFKKLLNLALNNVTSFSIFPLKIMGYLGLIMILASIFSIIWILADKLIFNNMLNVKPQTYLILTQIFLTGTVLISVSFSAIYIKKILNNTNNRQNYIIEKKI